MAFTAPTKIGTVIVRGNGFLWVPPDVTGLKRDDGSPSQPGDVASLQPDLTWQTRNPANQNLGPFETFQVQGPFWVYTTGFDAEQKTVFFLAPGL